MNNVWGKGGLFEQALANKMQLQTAQADTMRQNADTNRMGTENQYDLGLRNNAVSQFNAETQRTNVGNQFTLGQQQNAVAQQNANTNLFGAETQRADAAAGWQRTPDRAAVTQLGLRTFQASPDPLKKPPFGMKNGGMIMKPKMVKQPGYMHGGKITAPKGYRDGGKIGNVKKDDGTDKVDVVAREGEYFLNPETVAHVGGGSYEQGVRKLDNLVRQATGKEPGPSPVGKSGKPGFAGSGALALIPGEGPRQIPVPGTALVPIEGTQRTGYTPNWTIPQAAPAADQGVRGAAPGRGAAYNAGRFIGDRLPSGQALRSAAGTVAAPALAGGAMLSNVDDKADFYNSPSVPTTEKAKQWLRDVKNPTLATVGGTVGVGAGAGLASLATGAAGAAAGLGLAKQFDDEGAAYKAFRAANPKPVAAPPAAPAAQPAPRDFDKEVKDKLAESEAKQPSLRDMMLARVRSNDEDTSFVGNKLRFTENQNLMKHLSDLDERQFARASSMAAAVMKNREDADKRIDERYQIPKFDKEGRIVGYEKNPEASKGVRDFAAQLYGQEGRPFDFYALSKDQQDRAMLEYDINNRGTRRLNERFAGEGGAKARTSMVPRMNNNALRADGEISLGDIGDPNISLGDWLTSWGPNKMEKMVLRDPVTGQRVAARHVLLREDGTIDQDLVDQMNRAAEAGVRRAQ